MDFYKKFSNLKVSESLFKELKFYVTGNIPEWVIQLLISGGAKNVSYITETMTHLITGSNPNEDEISEVKDLYTDRPIVTQNWVIYSAKCERLLPVEGFHPEASQLFSGVKASVSKLGIEDSNNIWGLINFYGGKCTIDLDHKCTHLIIGKPEGIKFSRALEKPIIIVTPDWVIDTVQNGERMDENLYHPRLLNASHSAASQNKRAPKIKHVPKPKKTTTTVANPVTFSDPPFTPKIVPPAPKDLFPPEEKPKVNVSKPKSENLDLFDSIAFSDDDDDQEEESHGGEKKNLLDQLKCVNSLSKLPPTSLWKQSTTPPISSNNSVSQKSSTVPVSSSGVEICSPAISQVIKPSTTQPVSIEASSKSSLPPYPSVSIATPSISITPHSASAAILPQSLLGSYSATSSSKTTPTTTGTTRASSNTPAIISTSEVDISYISKHSIQNTSSASSLSTSQQSDSRAPVTPATVSMTTAPFSAPSSTPVGRAEVSNAGKPLSKLMTPGGPPFTQSNRSVASPVTYSSLPSFSSSQTGQLSFTGNQRSSPQTSTETHSFSPQVLQPTFSNNNQHLVSTSSNSLPQTSLVTSSLPSSNVTTVRSMSAPNQAISQISNVATQDTSSKIPVGPPTQVISSNPPTQYTTHVLNQGSVQFVRQGSSVSVVASQGPSGAPSNVVGLRNSPSAVGQNGLITKQMHQVGAQNQTSVQVAPNQNMVAMSSTPNVGQQHVQSVALPGAVVRLPAGVTHQQLQMMTLEERQRFLDQLRKQQLHEPRGKPRPGKPVSTLQYKTVIPGAIRYQNTIRTQVPVNSQSTSTWPPSSAPSHGHPAGLQGTNYAALGQIQGQASAATSPRTAWHPTSQQQQFTPVGQTRVVQQGWQQVQQPSPSGTQAPQPASTTQGLLPQQLQQLHAQQLRQHFPHLTQQEAQQIIQTIPGHLREIQSRDNAGRFEYLSKLEEKESEVVKHFYVRRQHQQMLQRQQQLQAQQQAQLKIGAPPQSPNSWASPGQQPHQFPSMSPHARPARPLPQGYVGQTSVSPGQGSPHVVQQQMASPLVSPHGHSPIQRQEGSGVMPHPVLQGSSVAQNLVNQQNLVNPKTKTALANLLTNRLSGSVHQGGLLPQGAQSPIEVATHIVQKPGALPETIQSAGVGPGGEQVVVYQRRTLGNITGSINNNIVRAPGPGSASPSGVYPRTGQIGQQTGPSTAMTPVAPHYARPHLFGHDVNLMLPRELCMVGCVFYIADYHGTIAPETLNSWKFVIQQHGGEVFNLYESNRVTHVLCQHQKSPVFQQAIRDNKRCITIYWVNDILIRGKLAPPWQAIHLPTPFGNDDKPMHNLLVSVTGFENEERTTIKLMLQLAGAKYTGYFSKGNHLLVCKKFEGVKVNKAREWKKSVVNGSWLSEVLLGQNIPPLVYHGAKYQHYLDDPLRIDPSLASHLFNAWKFPISVSKESVEKAKAVREMAMRKRKTEKDGDHENKKQKLDSSSFPGLESMKVETLMVKTETADEDGQSESSLEKQPKIILSNVKNKEEVEKKIVFLGGVMARTNSEMTHLIMGSEDTAPRTVNLMCAISCAKYVVSLQWLKNSHAQQKFLAEENYLLRMPEFEKVFDFSLRETMKKPNRRELFASQQFFLTPSVVPGRTWLKEIIECAGGHVDTKRKSLTEIKERNKDGKKRYICITTEDDSHLLKDLLQDDQLPVLNSEFVLASILKQQEDFTSPMFKLKCVREE